jgi:hypothetical protein
MQWASSHPRPRDKQRARNRIAQRLRGVKVRAGENTGHRDAAADEHHSECARDTGAKSAGHIAMLAPIWSDTKHQEGSL